MTEYYSAVDCVFDTPRSYGFPFSEKDHIVLKVLCVKPVVTVKKEDEQLVYEDIKNVFSEWLTEALRREKYSCKLLEWYLVQKLSLK